MSSSVRRSATRKPDTAGFFPGGVDQQQYECDAGQFPARRRTAEMRISFCPTESPYNGQDKEGLTALILSLTKLDNSIHAGGNQNLKFARSMFEGDLTQIKSVLERSSILEGSR